jgi:hypothetical protein
MKHLIVVSVLIVLAAPTPAYAAESKVDRYIAGIRSLLKKYQNAIAGQVAENRKQYREIAAVAEKGHRDRQDTGLRFERTRRSERLANDYADRRKPVSQWKDDLLEYAQLDYQLNRDLLRQESTDGAEYLIGLETLKFEQAKLEALDTILEGLAKPASFLEQVEELGSFAAATKEAFDKKVCDGSKADLTAKVKVETDLKAVVAALLAKPQDAAVVKELTEKQDALKAASAAVKGVTEFRQKKGCS